MEKHVAELHKTRLSGKGIRNHINHLYAQQIGRLETAIAIVNDGLEKFRPTTNEQFDAYLITPPTPNRIQYARRLYNAITTLQHCEENENTQIAEYGDRIRDILYETTNLSGNMMLNIFGPFIDVTIHEYIY